MKLIVAIVATNAKFPGLKQQSRIRKSNTKKNHFLDGKQQQHQQAAASSGGRRLSWTTEEIFIARGFRRESTTEDMMRCRNFRRQSQQVTNGFTPLREKCARENSNS